ncbi:MAG: hypothetical protein HFG20_01620 [Anaerotruncus sp.]|jgi:hypothetical protein|nr:hypothetical protein [Anaerotruncus sp.]
MKQAEIQKTADLATPEQLALINRFARRELDAQEVYLFSLVLCDNEIDREQERFCADSLEKLAALYVGKTGIFNHDPKGENQTARIFDARVEYDPKRKVAGGENYAVLRAWAYMVRCPKNEDLILEIDAGIKKEVSVGCAVERVVCSVCGTNLREKTCEHRPGQTYNGVRCWRELVEPVDAYEWSFVAVPAQRQAGVTKHFAPEQVLEKALREGKEVTLSAQQAKQLDALVQAGKTYQEGLRRKLLAAVTFTIPQLPAQMVERVAARMETSELEAFCKALSQRGPLKRQLGTEQAAQSDINGAFLI